MASTKVKLTISEQIERAITSEGRTQTWIIEKMNGMGFELTDTTFSNKKNEKRGFSFTPQELSVLSEILGTTFE